MASGTDALEDIMGKINLSIRQADYDVWTSVETKRVAEDLGIIFVGFRPLQELQEKLMKKKSAK